MSMWVARVKCQGDVAQTLDKTMRQLSQRLSDKPRNTIWQNIRTLQAAALAADLGGFCWRIDIIHMNCPVVTITDLPVERFA